MRRRNGSSDVVRRMHARVAGEDYRADDPELQVWVAATLFATAVHAYRLLFRELTTEELETYYEQSKVFATILGCPYAMVPASYEDFREYYARTLASLRISDASRAIAHQVLHPRLRGGRLNEPGLAAIRLLTVGLMPDPIRRQYGWRWDRARQARFHLLIRALRLVYPRLPLPIRTLPRDYYLHELRAETRSRVPVTARRRAPSPRPFYSPVQSGGRFSAKAAAPSIASLEVNTGPMISPCRANASSLGQSADSTMTRLVAASASGAFAATLAASSLAASSASPGPATAVDQAELGAAAPAGKCAPVSAISMATWYGIRSRQPQQAARRRRPGRA